ncbi:MAG: SgcJ/EcaC family oxidoreductase [Candidatus Eremiobacteraeota bacterium]|nr:SgcJ/EcaC family oxidoreductase [Candidatus Eremiobacteraeota bacterium]
MLWRFITLAALFSACMLRPVWAADRATDESAIRDLVGGRQQDAWNKHDAHAYAELFAEDGDVVNVVAWWWKGRTAIEGNLTQMFTNIFRDSVLTFTEVNVRFLTPEIAIVHARWRMTGAHMPPGLPEPREGLQTITVQRRNGKWLIAAFQNTNYVPPPAAAP